MIPRVMHVIDHTGDGGAQVVVLQLVESLKNDFDFSIVNLGQQGRFSDNYQSLGIPTFEIGSSYGRWSLIPIIKLIRVINQVKPQLIHTHLFKSNILASIVAKLTNTPFLLHEHMGITPESMKHYTHYIPPGIPLKIYHIMYSYALDYCSGIIVLTENIRRYYRKHFNVGIDKLFVLPNSINLKSFDYLTVKKNNLPIKNIREELNLTENTQIVSMIGRLDPEKDWMTFLRVAKKCKSKFNSNCSFLVIGEGILENQLFEYAQQNYLYNVHFLGYRDDIPELLQQSDVFLLTSRREPFGIVILEAMAAECPVVATRSGGPEEIITNGLDGLLVDIGDVDGLYNQLSRLLSNDSLQKQLSQTARQKIKKHYDIRNISNKLVSIYSFAIGK